MDVFKTRKKSKFKSFKILFYKALTKSKAFLRKQKYKTQIIKGFIKICQDIVANSIFLNAHTCNQTIVHEFPF